jgi:DNA-binding NarL/FixJ family response regulator
MTDPVDTDGLSERDRTLLTGLSAGDTDETIAAGLAIDVRAERRQLADLMRRLGARSRFQAGVLAAWRGWPVAAPGTPPDPDHLSERERQLLALLAGGCSDIEMADRMDIGMRTTRRMVADLANRCGVRNRFSFGVAAAHHGLIERAGS